MGKRVLVVDDRAVQAEGLAEYLRRRGWDAGYATCGPGVVRNWPLWPADAVVLDWLLEGHCMGAGELLKWLAAQDPSPSVLVLTGKAPEELHDLPPGVPVLQKPQEPEAVWRAVEALPRRAAPAGEVSEP
jgi:DNA-binding response OmpR family regulator